jgi:hypothetical protein
MLRCGFGCALSLCLLGYLSTHYLLGGDVDPAAEVIKLADSLPQRGPTLVKSIRDLSRGSAAHSVITKK